MLSVEKCIGKCKIWAKKKYKDVFFLKQTDLKSDFFRNNYPNKKYSVQNYQKKSCSNNGNK